MGAQGDVRRPSSIRIGMITAAAMAAVTGCGGPFGAAACTDVGGISGVVFEFSDVLAGHPGEALVARACADDLCESRRIDARHRETGMVVGADQVTDETPVSATLTISRPGGEVVYEGRLVAHPVKSQPNGPGCPPTTWSAQLFASGQDDLRQADLSE